MNLSEKTQGPVIVMPLWLAILAGLFIAFVFLAPILDSRLIDAFFDGALNEIKYQWDSAGWWLLFLLVFPALGLARRLGFRLPMLLLAAFCFCRIGHSADVPPAKIAEMLKLGETQRQSLIDAAEKKLYDAESELELARRGKYFHKKNLPNGFYFEDDLVANFPNRQAEERAVADLNARISAIKTEVEALRDYSVPVVPTISSRWLDIGAIGKLPLRVELLAVEGADYVALVKLRADSPGEHALIKGVPLPEEQRRFEQIDIQTPVVVTGKQNGAGRYADKELFVIEAVDLSAHIASETKRLLSEDKARKAAYAAKERESVERQIQRELEIQRQIQGGPANPKLSSPRPGKRQTPQRKPVTKP